MPVIGTITALQSEDIVAVTDRPVNSKGEFYCVVPTCNETFSSMQGLKYHLTHVHNKTLVYKCSGCDELFPNARSRNNHQKSHTQDVTYCSFCTYNSKHVNDAARHEKKCPENPDIKWKCNQCTKPRKFQSDKSLLSHMQSVHKMKGRHICVYCKILFNTLEDLNAHKCPVKRKYSPK